MFVSIKKYMNQDAGLEGALARTVAMLIEAIRVHSVSGDSSEQRRFQDDIRRLEDKLESDQSPSTLLVCSGEILKTFKDHNAHVARMAEARTSELQSVVSMLTETVIALSAGSTRSVIRLQELEKLLEKASVVEDLRVLRTHLSECLESVREETTERQREAKRNVADLSRTIERSKSLLVDGASTAIDPVTSLPGFDAAEKAAGSAIDEGSNTFAVLFVVNRLKAVIDRFGADCGNGILLLYSQFLAQQLPLDAKLFRWQGPSFLALVERPGTAEGVRKDVDRVGSARLEHTTEIGNRSVLLPVTATWAIFALKGFESARALGRKMEVLLAEELARS